MDGVASGPDCSVSPYRVSQLQEACITLTISYGIVYVPDSKGDCDVSMYLGEQGSTVR